MYIEDIDWAKWADDCDSKGSCEGNRFVAFFGVRRVRLGEAFDAESA